MTETGHGQQPGTRWYAVSQATADRQLVEQVCLAVLEAVRPRTERICIDAYSDGDLPAQARAAQDELRARGSHRTGRRHGDPGMAVKLHPTQPGDWELLLAYAAFSIHVELADGTGELATLHDCGLSIMVKLTEAEASRLADVLPEPLKLEPRDKPRRGRDLDAAIAWPVPERRAGDRVRAALGLVPDLALGLIAVASGSSAAFAPTWQLRWSLRRQLRRVAAGKRLTVQASWTQGRLSPELARVRLSTGEAVLERSFTGAEDLRQCRPVALFTVGQAPAGGACHAGFRWVELATPKGLRYLGADERDLALIGRCAEWPYPPTR